MNSQIPPNQPQEKNLVDPVPQQISDPIPSIPQQISNLKATVPEQLPSQLSLEQIQRMKMIAKEQAIQQVMSQRNYQTTPNVVYVKRNLTVAELILVFIISSGIVFGIQSGWSFVNNYLPKIEIKMN